MRSKKSICLSQRVVSVLVVSVVTLLAACGGGQEIPSAGPTTANPQASDAVLTTPESQPLISGPTITLTQPALPDAQGGATITLKQPAMSGAAAGNIAASAFAVSDFLFDPAGYASRFIPDVLPAAFSFDASTSAWNLDVLAWFGLRSNPPMQPMTVTCSRGGSLASVASASVTADRLDTVRMVASNCSMIDGVTYNGELTSITVSQLGVPVPGQAWSTTYSFRFKHFSVVSTKGTVEFDGDLDFAIRLAPSGSLSFAMSGAAMRVIGQRNGQAPVDVAIQQYKTSTDFSPGEIRSAIEFTQQGVGSSGQAGTIVVKSPQTFVRRSGKYPSSGVLSVSDGVSSATVTALDGTSVRVDYSPAGDGVVTESTTLTWSQFQSPI